ncbi:hypothetical protein BT69DRAFT_1281787 [Atractiella rhizophila]|nr:hypothetical protein BT69DRAFT_1281787 [Atractiella rhizophila]
MVVKRKHVSSTSLPATGTIEDTFLDTQDQEELVRQLRKDNTRLQRLQELFCAIIQGLLIICCLLFSEEYSRFVVILQVISLGLALRENREARISQLTSTNDLDFLAQGILTLPGVYVAASSYQESLSQIFWASPAVTVAIRYYLRCNWLQTNLAIDGLEKMQYRFKKV